MNVRDAFLMISAMSWRCRRARRSGWREDGFALATGLLSLVNLHAAAGTGNAMGNLTNSQSGHVPVIVTAGQQARRYTELAWVGWAGSVLYAYSLRKVRWDGGGGVR